MHIGKHLVPISSAKKAGFHLELESFKVDLENFDAEGVKTPQMMASSMH